MDYKQELFDYYQGELEELWREKNKILKIKPISLLESSSILIDNNKYTFKKCTTLYPQKQQDIPIHNKVSGVYVFVVKRDFVLNLKEFFSEVTGVFFHEGEIFLNGQCFVPPYNGSCKNGKHMLKKDCVLYVGSSEDLAGRIYEHLSSKTHKSPTSLKLGFPFREKIKDKIELYYFEIDKTQRDLERNIRDEYGSYFGE